MQPQRHSPPYRQEESESLTPDLLFLSAVSFVFFGFLVAAFKLFV